MTNNENKLVKQISANLAVLQENASIAAPVIMLVVPDPSVALVLTLSIAGLSICRGLLAVFG